MSGKTLLIIGGWLSIAASLLHVAVIAGGPNWYRFFGAGEQMAQMAERGQAYPVILTLLIAAILAIWAAYAFSGAGLLPQLPLLRTGLITISAIYLIRGLAFVPIVMFSDRPISAFDWWSSLIVLAYGIAYAAGTWLSWTSLRPAGDSVIS